MSNENVIIEDYTTENIICIIHCTFILILIKAFKEDMVGIPAEQKTTMRGPKGGQGWYTCRTINHTERS